MALILSGTLYLCYRPSSHQKQLVQHRSDGGSFGRKSRTLDLWELDAQFDLGSTQFALRLHEDQECIEIRTGVTKRLFASATERPVERLNECCIAEQDRMLKEVRPVTAPSQLTKSVSAEGLEADSTARTNSFAVRQIVRSSSGRILRGTLTGLVRQLLLEKLDPNDKSSLSNILLHTIGLWASAESVLAELCEQLNILAESATAGRAALIVKTLLSAATSLLLNSKIVEGLLKLVEFTDRAERRMLSDDLWERRTRLLTVITMDLSSQSNPVRPQSDASWDAEYQSLSRSGLQAESVLAIPANLFASQLHIFHQYYLKNWNPANDKSLFYNSGYKGASRNPLVFSQHQMHFLTHTILSHILQIDSRPISSSQRAAICTQWIMIGIILKRSGDMTGWLATIMALCAPAVTRLFEMWSMVEDRLRSVVEREWSPVMRDLFRRALEANRSEEMNAHVLAPDAAGLSIEANSVVPFYGDLCDAVEEIRRNVLIDSHGHPSIDLGIVRTGSNIVNMALASYLEFLRECPTQSFEACDDANFSTITAFQDCFRQLNSMPTEITDVCSDILLYASLSCEGARADDLVIRKENNEFNLGTESYVPLLFTDQLPAYRLFEASDLLEICDPGKRPKAQGTVSSGRVNQAAQSNVSVRRLNSFPPTRVPTTYTTGHGQLDDTTRARTAASVSQWKMLNHVRELTGVSDRLIVLSKGNLVLKDVENSSPRKKRRPQSVLVDSLKRESTISHRSSILMTEVISLEKDDDLVIRPQKYSSRRNGLREVVVKAGTLDCLIDLLILDINDFRGLEDESPKDASNTLDTIALDRRQYLKVFLLSHRSYCSSSKLLEELTKRLKLAISASNINQEQVEPTFPNWTLHLTDTAGDVQWALAEKLFTGIFEVMSVWISLSPEDILTAAPLSSQLHLFIQTAERQISCLDSYSENREATRGCNSICVSHLKRLRKQILRVQHRPLYWKLPYRPDQDWENLQPYAIHSDLGVTDARQAVERLNQLVESILKVIRLTDWMVCYEILELQSLQPRGLYKTARELIALDQDVFIQDSLHFLENTTIGDSQTFLINVLPLPIRKLIQIRFDITSWTIAQVSEAGISIEQRTARLQFFLMILSVTGAHMSSFDIEVSASAEKGKKKQIVPSLIASAICAGLLSPQSRMFSLCWTLVAQANGKEGCSNTIADLITNGLETSESKAPDAPCPGWIIDRMLEIACYIPDTVVHNLRLHNFDKRLYIYNLLQNLGASGPFTNDPDIINDTNNQFFFLLGTQTRHFDWKALRSTAYRENQSMRNIRIQRPFSKTVHAEHEKIRRDIRFREVVDKHIREIQKNSLRKRQEVSRFADSSKRAGTRSKYGMNSLLRAVRPLSVAITGTWTPDKQIGAARVVHPDDLPRTCAIPRGTKPSITIDLVNSDVAVHNRKDNVLRICSEDGLETFFQAPTVDELEAWMKKVSLASIDGAKKRRTTIKEDAKIAAKEGVPQFSPRNSVAVDITIATFGIDLPLLVRREGSSIPRVAVSLIEEVERRGLQEVGIYRISGSLSTVNALKRAFDSGIPVNLADPAWEDINAVAGLFKLWLRELPEPLMTYGLYDKFLETLSIEDYAAKSLCLKELVHQLPVPNFSMLKRLIEHLEKVTDYEATNHMYAHNLAIVFGPNILQPTPSSGSFASSMNDLGRVQTLIRNLILQCHWIFATDDDVEEDSTAPENILSSIDELSIHDIRSTRE